MKLGIIKLDETEYWSLEIQKTAGKIYTYYLFNLQEVTHLCSLQGSYFLHPVTFETENTLTDDQHEEIHAAWGIDNDGDYFNESLKPHVIDEDFHNVEDALEYYQGNTPYFDISCSVNA